MIPALRSKAGMADRLGDVDLRKSPPPVITLAWLVDQVGGRGLLRESLFFEVLKDRFISETEIEGAR